MPARQILLADAATDYLNAATYSPAVTAVRRLRPVHERDPETLRLTVRPDGVEIVPATRKDDRQTHQIEVALEQSLDHVEDEAAALIELLETLFERLNRQNFQLPNGETAQFIAAEIIPYSPDNLAANFYTGLLTLSYLINA